MSRRIVFVTQDLGPRQSAGAATLVGQLARMLAESGHDVTVVHGSPGAVDGVIDGVTVVGVPIPEPDGTTGWFVQRSEKVARRLAHLVSAAPPPDLVEFTDFEAIALWAVTQRHDLGLERVRMAARLHGPLEAITSAIGSAPPPMDALARLERLVLPMLDLVLAPSAAMAAWAADRYDVEPERVVVAPPPLPEVPSASWLPAAEPNFAAYGRVSETKGAHDLVRAIVPVFERFAGATLRFVGPDGWSAAEHRPMSEALVDLLPARHRGRVEFTGRLPRAEALEALSSAWAVIVPSRFESFCLAAHEARRAGLPVIAADIPAFAGLGDGIGIRLYDGSIDGLTAALAEVAGDRSVAERLAAQPPPPVGDPLSAYDGPLPEPRHPRSQAGLATAAVVEVERLLAAPPPRWAGTARRLLRRMPGPAARLAVRIVPRRVKDRFRAIASWPEEQARREAEQRLRRTRASAMAGDFPEVDGPDVTVVIPCHEQGQWVTGTVLSVFEQTHPSWEIVLVDDGSKDPGTIRTLDELSAWPRVRLVRQENRGLPGARNAGMRASRGRYLVPLDADDELAPRFLEVLVARLDAAPGAAFAHCWAELFGDVEGVWATRPANPYWELLSNSVIGCVLLRRDAWEAAGGYDESMLDGNEDWELWVRLRAAGWDQVRVMEPLFRYRKHGVSMSVTTEAAFERGRLHIMERHPDRYLPESLAALKRRWYPLLTVIDDDGVGDPAAEDVESVTGSAAEAVAATRGKYVADRRGSGWPIPTAVELAERLEGAPGRAWAHDPATGVVVWRRWCLVDPEAEPEGGIGPTPPPGDLAAGRFLDPEWVVDNLPDGVRLFRHRPEEEGRLPGWVSG